MAYAIFWTLVVVAVAIALGYFFVNPREDDRGRTAARLKDRASLDTEFSRWLGLEDEEGDARDREGRGERGAVENTEAWNESTPRGTPASGRARGAAAEGNPAGIHQKTPGQTDGVRGGGVMRADRTTASRADVKGAARTADARREAVERSMESTDRDAARAAARAALGESAALLALDDAAGDSLAADESVRDAGAGEQAEELGGDRGKTEA
ncbi:MAG: hypothetical protein QJR01_04245 [Kyrpidia sp.]|nr:hypothetical protein [Kyrpidia sp.]